MRPPIYWLITDTHLYQHRDRAAGFFGRPEDVEQLILRNLCYYVAKQDYLIHLGDVIFNDYHQLKPFLSKIKCRSKILCIGNHDSRSWGWYTKNGFDAVYDGLQIGDVFLSHKPVPEFPGRFNIHGHFHNTDWRKFDRESEYFQSFYNEDRYKLFAIEWTDYKPIKLNRHLGNKKAVDEMFSQLVPGAVSPNPND